MKNLISYFDGGIHNKNPQRKLDLKEIYDLIISVELIGLTSRVRGANSKMQMDTLKKSILPFVTFAGDFAIRDSSNLIAYSGLIVFDIDNQPTEILTDIKTKLISDELLNINLLFISPSGNGLKFVIKHDKSPQAHTNIFNIVSQYLEQQFSITIDKSGKDIARACFLCHDTNAYFNESGILKFDILSAKYGQSPNSKLSSNKIHKSLDENLFQIEDNLAKYISSSIENALQGEKHSTLNKVSFVTGLIVNKFSLDKEKYIALLNDCISKKEGVKDLNHAFVTIKKAFNDGLRSPFHLENQSENVFEESQIAFENHYNTNNQRPYLTKELYDKLPPLIKELLELNDDDNIKFMLLISCLNVWGSLFPYCRIKVGSFSKNLNLMLIILGKAGIGKGNIKMLDTTIKPLKDKLAEKKPQHQFFIPGNASTSSFIQQLLKNNEVGVMLETEIDTFSDSNKQEWGKKDEILRKISENEGYSVLRKDKENSPNIERGILSVGISGTYDQLSRLINNVGNGLFSRFLFFEFIGKDGYVSPFKLQDNNLQEKLLNIGEQIVSRFADDFIKFNSQSRVFYIHFSEEQQDKVNKFFEDLFHEFSKIYEEKHAIVKRLCQNTLKIVAILTCLRQDKIESDLTAIDDDVDIALYLARTFANEIEMPYSIISNVPNNREVLELDKILAKGLPKNFKRSEAIQLAKDNNFAFSEKTLHRILVKSRFFKKIKHGIYMNLRKE